MRSVRPTNPGPVTASPPNAPGSPARGRVRRARARADTGVARDPRPRRPGERPAYHYRIEHRDGERTWYLGAFRSLRAGASALVLAARRLEEKDETGYVVLIDQEVRPDCEIERCDLPVWRNG